MYKNRSRYRRSSKRRFSRRTYQPKSLLGKIGSGIARYGPKALAIANQALSTTRALQGIINSELKYYDFINVKTFPGYPTTMLASPQPYAKDAGVPHWYLTGIDQGTTATTRTGNTIKVKSLRVRLRISQPPLGAIPQGEARVVIYLTTGHNGANPDVTEIYATPTDCDSTLVQRNVFRSKMYKILYDKVIMLNSQNTVNQCISKDVDIYLKFPNLHLDYINTGTNWSSSMNGIFIGVWTANSVGSNAGIQVLANSRVRFYDN